VQGTALVRAGDIVKKGDILIAPYVISSDGTTNTIKAKGVVKANIWLKGSTQFCENGQKLVRSGNCFSYNLIKLFGMQMPFKVTDNEYEYFEIERTTNFVAKDIVLPMIIENVKVYEMIYIAETKKFSEVEDILVRESVYKAYEQIKDNFEIISEQTDVVEVGGVYYINTYIKVSKNIGIY